MNTHLNWEETSTRISSRLAELPPKKGVVYVDGPSGVGKTSLLRHFAASAPEAVLVDATGCSTEEVADRVMQAIGVSCGNVRSIPVFTTLVKDRVWNRDFEPKTVVITNTQWAGKTRITHDPVAVATEGIVDEFSRSSKATNIKLVVEIDSEVCDLSPRNRNAILLPPSHDVVELSPESLPARQRTAMTALALSELHRVRFVEWQALCAVLGTGFDVAELRAIGERPTHLTVDATDGLSVSFAHERYARALRKALPEGTFRNFQQAITERLFACVEVAEGDPLISYLAHSFPAHAAAADRLEGLLSNPRALARCTYTALFGAFHTAFPHSIPAGSFAAELFYLHNLQLSPSSQAEWISLLHLTALSQGDTERADALAEAAGPLPWRTVWTHWRAPGHVRPLLPQIDVVEELQAAADGTTVTSRTLDGAEQTWHAATGRLLAVTGEMNGAKGPFIEEAPPTPSTPARWEAETTRDLVRAAAVGDASAPRVIQAPTVKAVACAGDLIVIGGKRGIYAIKPNPDYVDETPLPALPTDTWYREITPRPYDEAACRPTRDLVLDVFHADNAPLLTEEQLPTGLTHEPTRRFLTETGFPAVSNFLSLNTHNLAGTGLTEHTWEGTKDFETPVGDGPFYELGTWIGGILLLDGPTGRVLRQSRKNAVDGDRPGDPLAGTSLAQFTAMICQQWKYMQAYATGGALDGDDLIEELKTCLAGIDPAAAATRNWGHVTETDEFYYL
ncbi:SUKH-4 family immunity protein [Streptomyces sp. JHA19]|uniref:SUKH-4 family immunity protein n=1 Tax=Streptomyces sp. JHA19 TaxID=1577588 RepID=UPI00131D335F|nr:SUKH-4 family immunity protein [Streptomyces sp. JHA19]